MNFHTKAQTLVHESAVGVAFGKRKAAEKLVRDALEEARDEAEPRLKELEAEVKFLRKTLVYHYSPTAKEMKEWWDHCNEISVAGGNPPNEEDWWVGVACLYCVF